MLEPRRNEPGATPPPSVDEAETVAPVSAADAYGQRAVVAVLLALSGLPFVLYVFAPFGEWLAHDQFFTSVRGTRAWMMLGLGAWALLLLKLKLLLTGRTPEERRLVLRDRHGQPITRRDVLTLAVPVGVLWAYTTVEKDWASRFAWSDNAHAAASVAAVTLAVLVGIVVYRWLGRNGAATGATDAVACPSPTPSFVPPATTELRRESLAYLVGCMGRDATRLDLVERGLWGLRVHVIADGRAAGDLPLRAGETGVIGWPAQASAAIFDLGKEVPVMRLADFPKAAIGVPWELLEVRETVVAEVPPVPAAATANPGDAARWTAIHLLMALALFALMWLLR